MRSVRFLMLIALVAVVGSVFPAAAQPAENPAVTDLGNNVYEVNGFVGDIPNLLPAEDVSKMAALQSHIGFAFAMDRPSPDGNTVFVLDPEAFGLLDVRSGQLAPLPLQVEEYSLILSILYLAQAGLSDLFCWADADTLGLLGFSGENLALVTINKRSGAVDVVPLPPVLPESFAPDCSKALYRLNLSGSAPAMASARITWPTLKQNFIQHGPVWNKLQPRNAAERSVVDKLMARQPGTNMIAAQAEQSTYIVVDYRTGETLEVASTGIGAQSLGFAWSPDTSRIAVSVTDYFAEPTRSRGEKLPFDGALISEQVYRDATGNLPPAQNPVLQGNAIFMADLNSGSLQSVRAANGDGAYLTGLSWSPDNQSLLVRATAPSRLRGRTYPSYLIPEGASYRFYSFDGREQARFAPVQLSYIGSSGTFVSPDEVIFESKVGTDGRAYYYNRVSGEFRSIINRPGQIENAIPLLPGRDIFFSHTSFTEPLEYYRSSWEGAVAQLTSRYTELRQLANLRQDAVEFTLANGAVRRGVLIQPAGAPFPPQNQRIIVWQEGGPSTSVDSRWLALVESPFALLPSYGFAVLVVPLQGRFGVGPREYNALYDANNFGQIDIDEQAEIVRQMQRRGWTSAGKVGIVGCSYGGYFVTQSITRHPGLYSAAHSQCGLVDLFVEWGRGYAAALPYIEGLPPWKATAEYRRDSPIYQAEANTTPLLTFHGTNDFLPIVNNENLHLQVVNNNVPAKMLRFFRAGHGINNVQNVTPEESEQAAFAPTRYELYGAQEQLIWFQTYLK